MEEKQRREWVYDDIVKGMHLPDITYTITSEILERYLDGIDDLNPLYLDEEYARKSPFRGRIVPPISMAIYTTVSNLIKPLGMVIPPGLVQAYQRYEFTGIVRPDEKLLIKSVVEDKYEKKGRKFVLLRSEVFNEKGEKVGTSWLTPIWSK
ncbi:MAG TPA: MaoC family dehydratase N-terminal domain-containing protein [Syntrophales bacterium]|nr:MaoC family dehydratase N-terminal domain-containing protein [Syntrophales bacterium]